MAKLRQFWNTLTFTEIVTLVHGWTVQLAEQWGGTTACSVQCSEPPTDVNISERTQDVTCPENVP